MTTAHEISAGNILAWLAEDPDGAEGVLDLQERKLVRLFIRKERYGRFYSCLAYIPREQFNTENREAVQAILGEALQGERIDYSVRIAESNLARLQVMVRPRPGAEVEVALELDGRSFESGPRETIPLSSQRVPSRTAGPGLLP